ncbi:bifunctional folylpolyglutamate synthase/dihydrofolate synthase [Flavobacterium crassostreae]|uniref:Dihydrofolate synthase/folylpolyglutamate synthase n=1 Tax=Flavobacterium crassostreae TaxID=1763534 RepID=A0A1B9DXF5_9FLAO|nr:folylpolyglutamate synthase/dihydrofolate synthase family protein [Flavobacterium crassostreae]OCB74360.1 tetrahydrofolate synthase [Flavobacterium crassostreae]
MNYQETINWMFQQLPMYQLQGASAYKKDLSNTYLWMDHLKNPDKAMPFIHVAGTNGKGSTSHMLASVLQEAGYKVGLYTSPHLKDFRERIRINGKVISEDFVCSFIHENQRFFEANDLSFFEMSVGLALDYFLKEAVDIAIIEVGMGGRLDATNTITPLVSVITNIGLDHTQFLGNTLAVIAQEKAGIIKPNTAVVIGEYTLETKKVFQSVAQEKQAAIYFAADTIAQTLPSDLLGDYQVNNIKTVLQTLAIINQQNKFVVSDTSIKKGLLKVVQNTSLQGRWQQLQSQPKVIADTAHNKNGLELVFNQVQKENFKQLHVVFGVVQDKNLDEILPILPTDAIYYFSKPNNPRGLEAVVLSQKARRYGLFGGVYDSVANAYAAANARADKEDFIYIGGSTFVVAEIL